MYWREFWGFVGRNILIIVLMAVVAVSWPWTLIIILPIAIGVLRLQMAMWRLKRKFQESAGGYTHSNSEYARSDRQSSKKSGEVRVVQTGPTEQRVNDDVGEYVDFKEIKEDKTQK